MVKKNWTYFLFFSKLDTNWLKYPETPTFKTVSRNENSLKSFVSSATLHIYNVYIKGVQHKWMAQSTLRAGGTPPGQLIAVQAINGLKGTISG